MDLAVPKEVADMTEVEVIAAPEVPKAEVPVVEDMEVAVPVEDIRKDKRDAA
jgi:phage head maturation protease